MSIEAQERYEALSDTNYSVGVKFVEVGDLRDIQNDGLLRFTLPGGTDTLTASTEMVEEFPNGDFSWAGKTQDSLEEQIFLTKVGDKWGGIYFGGHSVFEVTHLDSTVYAFVERKNTGEPICPGPEISTPWDVTVEPTNPECTEDYNTCPAMISILIIMTPEAKQEVLAKFGSLEFFRINAQGMVNAAFLNSDIPNKSVRVTMIEKSGFVFSSPQNADDDLAALITWAESERDQYKSDLVFLLTPERYPRLGGFAPVGPDSDFAFGVVETTNFFLDGAFPHEVGHLLGCRHNWGANWGDDNEEVCEHGFRHLVLVDIPGEEIGRIQSFETLVTVPFGFSNGDPYIVIHNNKLYELVGRDRVIINYSNPDISYQGIPTGRRGPLPANNARLIRNTACDVASFYPTQDLAVLVGTSQTGCSYQRTFTANIMQPGTGLPGQPPYSVTWHWNKTGIFSYHNYLPAVLGSGATITVNDPWCPVYFVKCTVTSSDNIVTTRIIKVSRNAGCGCEANEGGDDRLAKNNAPTSISVFPNPAHETLTFVSGNDRAEIRYSIVAANGKPVMEGTLGEAQGQQGRAVNIAQLPPGLYFVVARMPGQPIQSSKIIKL